MGRKIYVDLSDTFDAQREKINISSWSPGLYIVKKGDETQKINIQ